MANVILKQNVRAKKSDFLTKESRRIRKLAAVTWKF